ncbi:Sonic hedgehog protein [Hondaea fermentalgiana]|uniref:Sonic hedgehog protein n=1 Tax=Hondaea fermentalgiana TaxID=2315210 RepID=A0A2R5GDL3_9STRA|nr:Sonic hedgehog protein [Hondaea fermentalgiana]|eukprot:GBG29020.1 Sonic hedgehog protein [Hondaea fermentalgiana]
MKIHHAVGLLAIQAVHLCNNFCVAARPSLDRILDFALKHSQAEVEEEYNVDLPLEISGANFTADRLQKFFNVSLTNIAPELPIIFEDVKRSVTLRAEESIPWIEIFKAVRVICGLVDTCKRFFELEGDWKGSYGIDGKAYPDGYDWDSVHGFQNVKRSVQAASIYVKNGFGNRCAEAKWWVTWSYGGQINSQGAFMTGIDIYVEKNHAWPCWVDAKVWRVSNPRNEGAKYWPIAAVDVYHEVVMSGNKYGCTMKIRGDGYAYQPGGGLCWRAGASANPNYSVPPPPTPRPTPWPTTEPEFGSYPSQTPQDGSGCLGGDSKVTLPSGMYKFARELTPGDLVVGQSGEFETVLAMPHLTRPETPKVSVLRIITSDDRKLLLTGDHLLPVYGRGLAEAALVAPGDSLVLVGENATVTVAAVHSVPTTSLYLPLTPSCTLLIDGIVISCASSGTLSPDMIQMLLQPLSLLYSILPHTVYLHLHEVIFVWVYPILAKMSMLAFVSLFGIALMFQTFASNKQ